ncbi:XkdX family protein [Paenibacillus tundrae]
MTDYQIFEKGYKYGWASEKQMLEAVKYKLITEEEYKQITGKEYM